MLDNFKCEYCYMLKYFKAEKLMMLGDICSVDCKEFTLC